MPEVFDPVLDVPEKKQVVENFIKEYFGDECHLEVIQGKQNIKYDFVVHNAYNSGKAVKGELKTRWPSKSGWVYQDVAVEITQFDNECHRLDELLKKGHTHKEVLKMMESYSTGWFYRSKANFILQITADHIDVILKRGLEKYIYKHAYELLSQKRYSGLTTGAYNVMVPYNSETKSFINRRFDREEFVKEIYR